MGRRKGKVIVRVHAKSWQKYKVRLKELSSRRNVQSIKPSLVRPKRYITGTFEFDNRVDGINDNIFSYGMMSGILNAFCASIAEKCCQQW